MAETYKRQTAYKYRIGQLLSGKPMLEQERLKSLDIEGKQVVRLNLIANCTDKYVQEGEKKFGSMTLDDGSGQIKVKVFGDDVEKIQAFQQGETLVVIGMLRYWNQEVYLTPEIIKKKEPTYLLIRKLEIEATMPKAVSTAQSSGVKEKLLALVKEAEKEQGIEIEKIKNTLKEHPSIIEQEIKKLLEEGMIYEPRPGKVRYLG